MYGLIKSVLLNRCCWYCSKLNFNIYSLSCTRQHMWPQTNKQEITFIFWYANYKMCLSDFAICCKLNTERTETQSYRRARVNNPSFSVTINRPLPSPGIKQRAAYMHKIQCKADYICSLNWLNAFKWDLCFFNCVSTEGMPALNGSAQFGFGDTIELNVSREQLDGWPMGVHLAPLHASRQAGIVNLEAPRKLFPMTNCIYKASFVSQHAPPPVDVVR